MISGQWCYFLQSLSVMGHCICYSIHTDSKVCSCAASLSPSNKPLLHFLKMNNWKRKLANKVKVQQKKRGGDNVWSEIRECKWIMEEIADNWNVDTAAIEEELREGTLSDTNKECTCNERMKMSQKKWCQQVFPLRKFSDICHDFGTATDRMLEDNPDLERGMAVH